MLTLLKILKDALPVLVIILAICVWSYCVHEFSKNLGNLETAAKLLPRITELEQEKSKALEDNLLLNAKVTKITNEFTTELNKVIGEIDINYQKGLEDGKKKPETIIAEYAAANKRLSIDLKRAKDRPSCNSGTSDSASTSGLGDDTERAELSDSASGFLISEADRADKVVAQLGACQKTVTGYYSSLLELNKKISALEKR